jgi:hypothetical protein
VLRAAAGTAVARGAHDAAALLLRRALEEPVPPDDRDAVLADLGRIGSRAAGPAATDPAGA